LSQNPKFAKQFTLDNLPDPRPKDAIEIIKPSREKKITITQIAAVVREDEELVVKITFKLYPSKAAFSRLRSDLWFDSQKINSFLIKVLQGPLATDELEYSTVLDMRGIAAGVHIIVFEMYELWGLDEKLWQTVKEATVNYVPNNRQERLVKVPTVRSVAGADLAVVSDAEKNIYNKIEQLAKKEQLGKRDEW
jgi:hypothetical protein